MSKQCPTLTSHGNWVGSRNDCFYSRVLILNHILIALYRQQYSGKLSTKSAEDIEIMRSATGAWAVLSVLNYLQALVDKSGIATELASNGASLAGPCHV